MVTKCFEAALAFTPWLCAFSVCLLAARRALTARVRARTLRAAWFVLAARAMLPVQFTLPHAPAAVELPAWSAKPVTVLRAAAGTASSAAGAPRQAALALSPFDIAALVWAAVAALLALLFAARCAAFALRLRRSRAPVHGQPGVYTTPLAPVPFAHGLLRPAVYLPEHTEEADLPYVVAHELRHIRAGDLWFQLALTAAQCVQWFNPLTYVMARAAREDMELACDETVLSGRGMAYRAGYAQAILNAMRRASGRTIPAAALCGRKMRSARWREIFNLRAKRRGSALLLLVCAAVAAASLMAGCASAARPAQDGSTPPQQSSPVELAPESAAPEQAAAPSAPEVGPEELVWPVPEYTYMARSYWEKDHPGLDICAAAGADILAVQGGTVVFSGCDESDLGRGNYVQIDCGDGLTMLYMHCNDVYVQEGETVEAGDRIASVGNTGISTGNHCCLRMERDGVPFDPEELLTVPY